MEDFEALAKIMVEIMEDPDPESRQAKMESLAADLARACLDIMDKQAAKSLAGSDKVFFPADRAQTH